ncbi:kinase-like protein [Phanerochaete sordida]|uniref:non-specific serine/threonine protein kinase n=1 Tax=Phanerochaete sordida TaxID=48140 RepID=A0A9P3G814_9APHY|nr:kinase-like protein [Phanerochaete sordida]
MRVEDGPDFYPGARGDVLDGRYELCHQLGHGVYSTTWLAKRRGSTQQASGSTTQYVALKLLSRDATNDVRGRIMLEVDAMKRLRERGPHAGLPVLYEDFAFDQSAHICLALNFLGSDVGSFRRSVTNKALAPHVARTIMRQVVDAVAHLHAQGMVHTDIKPDNILFQVDLTDEEIAAWDATIEDPTADSPYPCPYTPDCSPEEAAKIKVVLVDLGQCQWAEGKPTVSQFSAFSLRAPEIILKSDFSPAIDIWAIGCIVFEMLVGRWLFHPVDGEDDWSVEDDHLAKMMELTGETFSAEILARSPVRDEYFDTQGNLLRVDELYFVKIQDAMSNYKLLDQDEIALAADLVSRCCRLDPAARPSAAELALHPWFSKTDQ